MSRRVRILVAITLVTGVALTATPAQAANVTVKFGISAIRYVDPGNTCPVSVPAGSGGVKVLQAAKQKGCILSYKLVYFPGLGNFVQCINGICGTCTTYWAMYENGKRTSYGLDLFKANWGDRLVFVYSGNSPVYCLPQ